MKLTNNFIASNWTGTHTRFDTMDEKSIYSQLPNDIIMRIISKVETAHDIHKQKLQGTLNILLENANEAKMEIEDEFSGLELETDFTDLFHHSNLGLDYGGPPSNSPASFDDVTREIIWDKDAKYLSTGSNTGFSWDNWVKVGGDTSKLIELDA
jgi:hypothetical protein